MNIYPPLLRAPGFSYLSAGKILPAPLPWCVWRCHPGSPLPHPPTRARVVSFWAGGMRCGVRWLLCVRVRWAPHGGWGATCVGRARERGGRACAPPSARLLHARIRDNFGLFSLTPWTPLPFFGSPPPSFGLFYLLPHLYPRLQNHSARLCATGAHPSKQALVSLTKDGELFFLCDPYIKTAGLYFLAGSNLEVLLRALPPSPSWDAEGQRKKGRVIMGDWNSGVPGGASQGVY